MFKQKEPKTKLVNIGYSYAELMDILKKCIGENKGISKSELLLMLIPDFNELNILQKYYYNEKVSQSISALKRNNFIVLTKNKKYFIPTKISDMDQWELRTNNIKSGINKNKIKIQDFINNKGWKNIK